MLPINGYTGGAAKTRMASSCNGCRALRKGCSEDCTIRPCLQWIKTPEAQGNATVFLAKFYGRAGLLNLIAAAGDDDADARPSVFRSMLYEACGRIVNPVYGAVGLLWSGQWKKSVDAVQAVFKGDLHLVVPVDSVPKGNRPNPVVQADVAAASSEAAAASPPPKLGANPGASSSSAAYDIRHFAKGSDAAVAADLLRFARAAGRGLAGFKRAGSSSNSSKAKLLKGKGKAAMNVRASSPSPPLGKQKEAEELEPVPMAMELLEHDGGRDEEFVGSHDLHLKGSKEITNVEAASDVIQAEAEAEPTVGRQVLVVDQEAEDIGLELTLGFEPVPVVREQPRSSCGDQSGLRL